MASSLAYNKNCPYFSGGISCAFLSSWIWMSTSLFSNYWKLGCMFKCWINAPLFLLMRLCKFTSYKYVIKICRYACGHFMVMDRNAGPTCISVCTADLVYNIFSYADLSYNTPWKSQVSAEPSVSTTALPLQLASSISSYYASSNRGRYLVDLLWNTCMPQLANKWMGGRISRGFLVLKSIVRCMEKLTSNVLVSAFKLFWKYATERSAATAATSWEQQNY